MQIRIIRSVLIVMALLTLLCVPSQTSAQTQPRTDVVIRYYENSDTDTKLYLASLAPSSKVPQKLTDIEIDGSSDISPDGKTLVVVSGTADQDTLAYGILGATLNAVTVEMGHRVLWTVFSPDSRLLSYTTVAQEGGLWILGLVDLTSGNRVEFAGDYTDPLNKGAGFSGAGDVVGWSSDRKTIYLRTYFPFSASGGFDTLIALDISAITFDSPARYPMNTGTRLLLENEQIVNFAFADDGTKYAVMSVDAANPPENYIGTDAPPNTISVRDLVTGKELATFKSQQGQGLEFPLRWTPDSKKLLFAGGSYSNGFYTVNPTLHVFDVESNTTSDAALLDDPAATLENMVACADTVFFTTNVEDAQGMRTTTLYSAPLDNATQRTELLSGEFVPLLTCIPAGQ